MAKVNGIGSLGRLQWLLWEQRQCRFETRRRRLAALIRYETARLRQQGAAEVEISELFERYRCFRCPTCGARVSE